MPFCKVVKTKSYFMRYQTAFRRRREGKTDYNARRALIHQDKRKYNTPKYRLVVRFTNTDVIAQIVYARIEGDYVLCAAYAHELPRYGVPVGLKNYAATYCTGLLLARRVLAKLNLADKCAGVVEPTGEKTTIEAIEDGPKPFKCVLDTGLARSSTGARVFAALKGAVDGGLLIPHNEKRFVGFQRKEKKFDPAILREHIFGQHVAKWMKILEEEDKEKFDAQFAQFIKHKITAAGLEKMYKSAHQKIRADPSFKPTDKKKPEHAGPVPLKYRRVKMSLAQRKARFAQKLEQIRKRMGPIAPIEFGKTSDVQGADEEPEPEKPVKTQKGEDKDGDKKADE